MKSGCEGAKGGGGSWELSGYMLMGEGRGLRRTRVENEATVRIEAYKHNDIRAVCRAGHRLCVRRLYIRSHAKVKSARKRSIKMQEKGMQWLRVLDTTANKQWLLANAEGYSCVSDYEIYTFRSRGLFTSTARPVPVRPQVSVTVRDSA